MSSYQALAGFDEHDLLGTLTSAHAESEQLPDVHAHLLELFRDVPRGADLQSHEEVLRDLAVREDFYDRLVSFAKLLALSLAQERFVVETPSEQVERYKADVLRFAKLKRSVQLRFAEPVDHRRDFEPCVRKLLNTHVGEDPVLRVHRPVNIFDEGALRQAIADQGGTGAAVQADIVAHNLVRVIEERVKVDPAYYERFSKMIQDAIDDYRARRINELAYLARTREVCDAVANRPQDDVPTALRGQDDAIAIYGVVKRVFEGIAPKQAPLLAEETALAVRRALAEHDVVDYWRNHDAVNATRVAIDHFLYDVVEAGHGVSMTTAQMDSIVEQSLRLARHNGVNGR